MTRIATLFQTPLLRIERFDHPPNEVHVDGALEVVPAYRITFLRSGEFRVVRKSGAWDLLPGDVLFSSPGVCQRFFHPADGARDECLGVRFEQDLIEDALGILPEAPPVPKAPASARSAFQLKLIADALQSEDRMMLEGVALAAAQIFLPEDKQFSSWGAVERSYSWYRVRIQRVCELLTQKCAGSHSLSALAELAQMSPFHLNRVFHYMVGIPLHQYVIRLRVAVAAKAIREGQSVTQAAYAAGFNSLSFFSRTFRKHFGIAPREYRALKAPSQSDMGPGKLA
jgi:AraC-like DNA-binding protein